MRLLLISNSTNAGEQFLEHPKEHIKKFLRGVSSALFLPYAAATSSLDEYEQKVKEYFSQFNINIESLHHHKRNHKNAVKQAEAIVVGGGNTFKLLKTIQQLDIIETLRFKVLEGLPYIGWSAGANVACPTICTTNDMPIVEPDNFSAFNLVRFQINPHYLDANPDGHAGETRQERIEEFIAMDPYSYVVGLREGSILHMEDGVINLLGGKSARIFKHGEDQRECKPGDSLDFLFE
ncbi:MAG: dipeptidase PepE [Bacteroidales bacterium]